MKQFGQKQVGPNKKIAVVALAQLESRSVGISEKAPYPCPQTQDRQKTPKIQVPKEGKEISCQIKAKKFLGPQTQDRQKTPY